MEKIVLIQQRCILPSQINGRFSPQCLVPAVECLSLPTKIISMHWVVLMGKTDCKQVLHDGSFKCVGIVLEIKYSFVRDCPKYSIRDRLIICMDLQIRTTFGFRWVGGWVSGSWMFGQNLNIVRICKSVRIMG